MLKTSSSKIPVHSNTGTILSRERVCKLNLRAFKTWLFKDSKQKNQKSQHKLLTCFQIIQDNLLAWFQIKIPKNLQILFYLTLMLLSIKNNLRSWLKVTKLKKHSQLFQGIRFLVVMHLQKLLLNMRECFNKLLIKQRLKEKKLKMKWRKLKPKGKNWAWTLFTELKNVKV